MRVHIIEDEEKLARHLKVGLENEGYSVGYSLQGDKAKDFVLLHHEEIDLIILDLMLPQIDGTTLCQIFRKEGLMIPILILTARNTVEAKVEGLNLGADDYLTKPFSFDELIARIRALMRRPMQSLPVKFQVGDLTLDTSKHTVYLQGQEITLTLREYMLLEYCMRHPNQVLTREQILDNIGDINSDYFSNVVDVHIKNLRRKIGKLHEQEIFETIRGVGYRLKS